MAKFADKVKTELETIRQDLKNMIRLNRKQEDRDRHKAADTYMYRNRPKAADIYMLDIRTIVETPQPR